MFGSIYVAVNTDGKILTDLGESAYSCGFKVAIKAPATAIERRHDGVVSSVAAHARGYVARLSQVAYTLGGQLFIGERKDVLLPPDPQNIFDCELRPA